MKKRKLVKSPSLYAIIFASLIFSGCGSPDDGEIVEVTQEIDSSIDSEESNDDINISSTTKITSTTINLNDYSGALEINSKGTYTISGTLSEGMIYVNTEDEVTLIFNGIDITNDGGPCIYVKNSESVTLELEGENSISNTGNTTYETLAAAIYSKSDLVIRGTGSLNIEASFNHGIKGKDNVTVESSKITINSVKDCINVNDDLIISGGELKLISEEDECLQSDTNIYINDGTIEVSTFGDGIKAEALVEINGGTINIPSANEGIESKDVITVNDGKITIRATDDCINATNSITINGGEINVISATNDAIDSNGLMEIIGGDIYAVATSAAEGAFDCDSNSFIISGGTLSGLGSTHSQPTEGTQNVILANADTFDVISNIQVKDKNGNIVYEKTFDDYSTFSNSIAINQNKESMPIDNGDMPEMRTPDDSSEDTLENTGERLEKNNMGDKGFTAGNAMENSSSTLFISNENLKTGETYTVYVNGNELDSVTITSQVSTIGTISSMGGGMGHSNRENKNWEQPTENSAVSETTSEDNRVGGK